ncbi:MAG: PilZ domain-containing protein [Deltaproteobacteria bacterium]|nr:PilZ domain-containing protein [Deltaproteobacteria bacterium]
MFAASPTEDVSGSSSRLSVLFGARKFRHLGSVKNISSNGLVVCSHNVFRPGAVVQVQIKNAEEPDQLWSLRGRVRWSDYLPAGSRREGIFEMGIEFVDLPLADRVRLGDLERDILGKRREPRFSKSFRVSVNGAHEDGEFLTANLSRHGMFITTSRIPDDQADVDLHILNIDIMEIIRARAKVIGRISVEEAVAMGSHAGFNVQFTDFFPGDEQIFQDYIASLEKHYNLE